MSRLLLSLPLLLGAGCIQDKPLPSCSYGTTWTGDPGYHFEPSNWGPGPGGSGCTVDIEDFPYHLAADTFNSIVGLNASEVQANFEEAVGVVNDGAVTATADVEIQAGDLDTGMSVSLDNDSVHLVFMVDDVHTDDDTNAGARIRGVEGQTFECDIVVFNRRTHDGDEEFINWSTDDAALVSTERSLLRTFTHELGHCLGLAHNKLTDSIMNNPTPDGTQLAPLSTDDLEALLFIYG